MTAWLTYYFKRTKMTRFKLCRMSCATEKYVSAAGCAAGYAAGYAPDIPAQPSRLGFSEILRYKRGILRSWTNRGWSSAPISCAVSCNVEKHETTRMSA